MNRLKSGLVFLGLLSCALPVFAYIGPGAGVSVVGSLLNTLLVILLAVAAILFWPVRLVWRKLRNRGKQKAGVDGNGPSES